MPAKLGLPVMFTACLLLFAAPALAADVDPSIPASAPSSAAPTETTDPLESTTSTTTPAPPTTTPVPTTPPPTTRPPTTGTPATVADLAAPDPLGPATASQSPSRGTQVQIKPPPPPPPPPVPWYFVVPPNSGSGRRVVYSKSQQSVWAFDEHNTLIKMHRVSGKQTPYDPRPGVYQVYSRSRYTYSINNPSITWGYMVRFAKGANGGNIGFHEIPYQYGRPVQSVAQLGQALSGGCVRQAVSDAVWMWNWAGVGTVVVVTP